MALAIGTASLGARMPAAQSRVLDGTWGGDRIRLIASSRDLRLQIDCLAGRLEAPVALDTAGRFGFSMRLVPIGGARLEGDDGEAPLARISGRVEQDAMRLTVGPEGRDGSGAYALTRGGKATLPNCRLRS